MLFNNLSIFMSFHCSLFQQQIESANVKKHCLFLRSSYDDGDIPLVGDSKYCNDSVLVERMWN